MTIAIGLICKKQGRPPAIILASDSQTTSGATKSLDAKKITIVNFRDAQVLVAQAGTADLADKAIDLMQKKAKHKKLENDETVGGVAQESIMEIRAHLIEINKGCNFSEDAWKRFFFEDNFFELMVAYYFDFKPCLFTINVDWTMPIPVKAPFKAIGIGKNVGEMLLREYHQCDPDFEFGYVVAASVVEKTIDNADGCGRPTWMGHAFPLPKEALTKYQAMEANAKAANRMPVPYRKSLCSLVAGKDMATVVDEITKAELGAMAHKQRQLLTIIQKIANKNAAEILQQTKPEDEQAIRNEKKSPETS